MLQPGAYINKHRAEWKELATKHGLKSGVMDVELDESKGGYQHFMMKLFDFGRHLDLNDMRKRRAWRAIRAGRSRSRGLGGARPFCDQGNGVVGVEVE